MATESSSQTWMPHEACLAIAFTLSCACALATACAWNQPSRAPERDEPVTELEDKDAGRPVHHAPPPRYGDRVAMARDGGPD